MRINSILSSVVNSIVVLVSDVDLISPYTLIPSTIPGVLPNIKVPKENLARNLYFLAVSFFTRNDLESILENISFN
ncbi:hypothetical protein KFE94_01900 [bacterium SCSIO 12643]|nr:hypothetical protein KFE94_01900 [bacterium SCSIO 12643]